MSVDFGVLVGDDVGVRLGVMLGVNVGVGVDVLGSPVGIGSSGARKVAQASVAKANIITHNPI